MTFAVAPGKLFLAGEYAVVEPGRQAVLVAVDQYVRVDVMDSAQGQVSSAHYGEQPLTWLITPDSVASAQMNPANDVAFAAIVLVDELLREHGLARKPYKLSITSQLTSADGRKYGLGSSAAVIVASLKALNQAFGLELDDLTIVKLGILASLEQNPNTSGGDIATSATGGWLHYASPDRDWVRSQRQTCSLGDLLAAAWPGLVVRRLPEPANLQLLVGWTGSPASTTALVAAQRAPVPVALLDASDAAVQALVGAIEANDAGAAQHALHQAGSAVQAIAQHRGRQIETTSLRQLREIAQAYGAVAKTSGAGGGDCGIALLPVSADPEPLQTAWRNNGIEPLDLKVST